MIRTRRHPRVKALRLTALCALAGCASSTPRRPAATATTTATVSQAAQPEPARPTLTPPPPAELDALQALLARGPAVIVRNPDGGADARITMMHRARAPLATLRRTIATPAEYGTFMPILRGVEVLSTHGTRTGFRFDVAAPLFNVSALCEMRVVGERRVDVEITESETGPGASRWDFYADGPEATTVVLTTWGDPSRGHWLLRQFARRSPASIAGMNIAVDSVLVLGASRRAEILAGASLPMRPERGDAAAGDIEPPPRGAWQGITRTATVLSMLMTPEGQARQVSVSAWTPVAPDVVMARLRDIDRYTRVWGSYREVERLPPDASDPPGSVRFRSRAETPLSRLEGVQRARFEGAVAWHEGLSGDYVGETHRWDLTPDPEGGTVVTLTGGTDLTRAGFVTRALIQRDPWLVIGFAGSWKIVWLRHLLRGL